MFAAVGRSLLNSEVWWKRLKRSSGDDHQTSLAGRGAMARGYWSHVEGGEEVGSPIQ